ncbi:GIY-YIG nuclease family protein [Kocuria rhizosphaericola]|uniref:GIY-YIG nuclease family protein n=1 Tax=Kocuria rhizosphaericola TaxID=3376284 RepID=UPI00379A4122
MESPVFTHYPLTDGATLSQLIGPTTSRCGIYVLTFANVDQYVGQAKNVLTRFTDHYDRWGRDIHSLDFAPAAAQHLNLYELLTIRRRLAAGVVLRNDVHTKVSAARPGMSPVLDLDTAEAIERALLTPAEEMDHLPCQIPPSSGATPRRNTATLLARPDAHSILDVLAAFVRYALPDPAATEGRYWKVKAPLSKAHDGSRNLVTLVVQNVPFVHVREESSRRITVEVHLDPQPVINPDYGAEDVSFPYMLKGSPIQRAHLSPDIAIKALTDDAVFRLAARRTVRRLMHKGQATTMHIPDPALADTVFSHIVRLEEGTP